MSKYITYRLNPIREDKESLYLDKQQYLDIRDCVHEMYTHKNAKGEDNGLSSADKMRDAIAFQELGKIVYSPRLSCIHTINNESIKQYLQNKCLIDPEGTLSNFQIFTALRYSIGCSDSEDCTDNVYYPVNSESELKKFEVELGGETS